MRISITHKNWLAAVSILIVCLTPLASAVDVRHTTVEPFVIGTITYYGDEDCSTEPTAASPKTGGLVQVFPANFECSVNGTDESISMTCNTDGTLDTFETFPKSQSCQSTARDDSSIANNCGFIEEGTELKCFQVEVGGVFVPALHYVTEELCNSGSLQESLPASPSYYIPPEAVDTCVPYNEVLYAIHSCQPGNSKLSSFFRDADCTESAGNDAPLDAIVLGECFSLGDSNKNAVYSSCVTIEGSATNPPTGVDGKRDTSAPTDAAAIQTRVSSFALVSAAVMAIFSTV